MSVDSDYERYCDYIDPDVDIASTHERNKKLDERDAVKGFFNRIENIITLDDGESRKWIGSLPDEMFKEAIPLFTDYDHNVNYQLHFSYTGMKGFHTYALPSQNAAKNEKDNIFDAFIHRLVHITTQNEAKLISEPSFVIPLENLFVHESGYAR